MHKLKADDGIVGAVALAITLLPPAALQPDPTNPRQHKPPQIALIAKSILAFGFNVPVLIDGDRTIIAGHGRVAAALKLGLAEVPVIQIEHLSPAHRRAYMIADNRLTESSRWDERLLGEVLRDLTIADLNFNIEAIGFSATEIDFKIEALNEMAPEDDTEIPVPAGPTVNVVGDKWQLGQHRLLCGNALDPLAWNHLMAGEKAVMVFADVPYNVPIRNHVSGLGKIEHREFAMASGEMGRDEFSTFLHDAFALMASNASPGSLHYVCIDWRHLGEMQAAGDGIYSELKNVCVWVKPSGGMGSQYRSRYELIFVWKNGRGRHRNNVELGKHGRNRTNVWEYASIAAFRHSEGGDLLAAHPTCKPVQLVVDAILDVTARGDIVVDPFMGSGTTLIAAQRIGHVAYGLELDPVYCDTIIRRYEALTGDQALHMDSGLTFADTLIDRCGTNEGEAQ